MRGYLTNIRKDTKLVEKVPLATATTQQMIQARRTIILWYAAAIPYAYGKRCQ